MCIFSAGSLKISTHPWLKAGVRPQQEPLFVKDNNKNNEGKGLNTEDVALVPLAFTHTILSKKCIHRSHFLLQFILSQRAMRGKMVFNGIL